MVYGRAQTPDTLMSRRPTEAAPILAGDSITGHGHTLPEFTVYGINKAKHRSYKQPDRDMQLVGIQPSDMSFKPLGLINKIIRFLFKKRKKETRAERTRRILNEYDTALPVVKKQEKSER